MNSTRIWSQIHDIIVEVFRNQQSKMLKALKSVPSKAKFFELSRFDFVVDDELNVFLMEANMSPNLSSGHFGRNQVLYEQVLLNIFSLVGIAPAFTKKFRGGIQCVNVFILSRMKFSSDIFSEIEPSKDFVVSESDIHVSQLECFNGTCSSCDAKACMTATTYSFLRETFLEHVNRRNMKMLTIELNAQKPSTKEDHLLRIWRRTKCEKDTSWC